MVVRILHRAAGALLIAVAHACAADYPVRPIRLVVPFPAGGGSDTLARIFAPKLGDALGQQVVVDNRGGAAGNIASEIVAKAAPDGYTLMLTVNSVLTTNPTFYPDMKFSVERDLQPLTQLSSAQYVLLLHPGVQANSAKELIELARARPALLSYASSGIGSTTHLAGELLKWKTGINIVHVPYKGAGPSVLAALMGETQLTFASVAASLQYVQAGKLKALAATALKRSPALPELPTLDESGVRGYNVISWHALLVTGGTPDVIVGKLVRAAQTVAHQPLIGEAMVRQGMETTLSQPAALAVLIKSETAMWRGVIKAANIRAE